ncbi:aldehyde dehydrogenase family protein [Nocardioides sambongensis]|uniref:aldehyde dehydrogenase family protein n=1 Tax=Nocardioides sambongensis TaxID=2589074 RepID=UPI00112E3540|nr:aldehyde dehydrogenase family protein [Nocardioides sambongensis]
MSTEADAATSAALAADLIVERLTAGETRWARTPLAERAALLTRFVALVDECAEDWVRIACEIKGLPADSPLVGEEWMSGPWATASYVQALHRTLTVMAEGGDPLAGFDVRRIAGDRIAVDVLPSNPFEWLLLNGFTAQVWMRPGVGEDELVAGQGLGQRTPDDTAGVAAVLGAGNITSIVPSDLLYVLYADNRVAAVKLNPISDPLAEVYRRIFAPFIEIGAIEIVTGGLELGAALIEHPDVAAVHMTGSEATHDAIVWGTGETARANRAAGTPALTKPITSELGGAAPVVVVPGKWSKRDLRFQAQHIATQRLHNGGSNCIAAQVVVLSADWEQKDDFLRELTEALAAAPARLPWYPGTVARADDARRAHPRAVPVGGTAERTLITGLDPADPTEPAFRSEFFGPVLGVTEIPGRGSDFLARAVDFCNDRLRGTLGANIVLHPRTRRALGEGFEDQVARLRYGTIGINVWTGVGYLTANATWGAFPGHPLDDIQSGRGIVHNALLLDGVERTVVRGPFRPSPRSIVHGEWSLAPKPPWFVDNRTATTTGRRLTRFAAHPRWRGLPAIFASALRG